MAGFGDGRSRNAHNTARGANPDNLDIKPAVVPTIVGTNWFPLKTLDLPYADLMPNILMIFRTGENSKSLSQREFSAVKPHAVVTMRAVATWEECPENRGGKLPSVISRLSAGMSDERVNPSVQRLLPGSNNDNLGHGSV